METETIIVSIPNMPTDISKLDGKMFIKWIDNKDNLLDALTPSDEWSNENALYTLRNIKLINLIVIKLLDELKHVGISVKKIYDITITKIWHIGVFNIKYFI